MKKQTYLSLLIGLFIFSTIVHAQAQYKPRFIFEKNQYVYNAFGYSFGSYVLSSSVENTQYETYIEGSMARAFYAKQTIKAPGKPEVTRELNTDELKLLPYIGMVGQAQYQKQQKKAQNKNPFNIEMSSWRMTPSGLMVRAKSKANEVKFLDFKVKNLMRIPFSRQNQRTLEKMQKNWQTKLNQWNNTYTFVIRQDSVYFKENKAYGIRKVVKVKNGKVVDIKAFKVVQNWLGRRINKHIYEEKAVKLSKEEIKATPNLDQFFSLSLSIINQKKHNTSFYKNDKGEGFEVNQFFRNDHIETYVLEKVSAG